MKSKKPANDHQQRDLLRVELTTQSIDPQNGIVKLANMVDWSQFDEFFGTTYFSDNGRPAISTRLMVCLKNTHNLSDDDIVFLGGGETLLAEIFRYALV